jgi:hypothetical protein
LNHISSDEYHQPSGSSGLIAQMGLNYPTASSFGRENGSGAFGLALVSIKRVAACRLMFCSASRFGEEYRPVDEALPGDEPVERGGGN